MAKQSSVNLDITNNADGFDMTGGTTRRKLSISGGDIIAVGAGTSTYTFPSVTSTLYGTGGIDVDVTDGGTGVSSIPAYAVITGGLTNTSVVQTVSGLGDAGQVLTSNGIGALPVWSTPEKVHYPATIKLVDGASRYQTYSDEESVFGVVSSYTSFSIACAGLPMYVGGVQQSGVTPTSIWAGANVVASVMIIKKYIYAYLKINTTDARIYRCLLGDDIKISGNWTQLTISGTAIPTGGSNVGFVGFDGSYFYIAAGTNPLTTYSLSGTTLTSVSTVTITGSNYDIRYMKVNKNGIYASFSSTPNIRFASHNGTLDAGRQRGQGVALSGATENCFYVLPSGGSITYDLANF